MDKKLKGIKANNSSITVSFTYKGERCRETVKIKPTKSALKEMARKRDVILYEIELGTFKYEKHFPNSKKAQSLNRANPRNITIKQMIDDWITRNQINWEYSTRRGYLSKIKNHIEPVFGDILVCDFKPSIFKDWGTTSNLKGKTKNEIRSILRSAFQELYLDEIITINPMDRVQRFKHIKKEPEPFTNNEREAILAQMSGQIRNLYEFAFWTGLRTSELLALRKEDVDLRRNLIFIRQALVHSRTKGTKTKSGERTHELHGNARIVLEKQLSFIPPTEHIIFLDPKTMKQWKCDRTIYNRCWIPALKSSGVKYRTQYNTRHTYASHMLTNNCNIAWLAKQLGHKDISMTLSTYARWNSNSLIHE